MRRVTVLSVDWDYFFPDPTWYDWTHNEESSLFYEMIWSTRPSSRNMMTGDIAYQSFVPDRKLLDGFWDRVLGPCHPLIYVCESHKTLGEALDKVSMPMDIWNFDQHHDLGYDKREEMDCGNWAAHVLKRNKRSRYNLVYPPWRAEKGNQEKDPTCRKKPRVLYEVTQKIEPDVLFVCRSSCWTPSWSDKDWLAFLEPLEKIACGYPWKERKFVEFVTKARYPNLAESAVIASQWDDLKASLPGAAKA
jgi:hypothetical protein